MISLRQKTERRSGGMNLLTHKLGAIMLGAVLAMAGILSMNSICLAQGDTWATKAPMPTARSGLSVSVVDGKIYAIGGSTYDLGSSLKTVEEYDPMTDTWTTKSDMPTARQLHCAAVVNGIVYVFGGDDGTMRIVRSTEAYDPATDSWTTKADMPTPRATQFCAAVDGKIYVMGGTYAPNWPNLKIVEEYDPATDSWTRKADMPAGRWSSATSVADGIIYTIGGQGSGGSWTSTVYAYDPATDTWTQKTNMPTGRSSPSASAVNGTIYVIGGATCPSCPALSTVETCDSVTGIWTQKANMPTARWNHGSGVVNGKIYVIGGVQLYPNGPGLETVEEYTPETPVSVENNTSHNPTSFALLQNYPNPFNPETRIKYQVSKPTRVVLQVINLLGQEVRTLVDEDKPAGFYEVQWDGRNNAGQRMPSGVYLYRMEAQGLVMTRKMVLLE